jgi:hypothetical protein
LKKQEKIFKWVKEKKKNVPISEDEKKSRNEGANLHDCM